MVPRLVAGCALLALLLLQARQAGALQPVVLGESVPGAREAIPGAEAQTGVPLGAENACQSAVARPRHGGRGSLLSKHVRAWKRQRARCFSLAGRNASTLFSREGPAREKADEENPWQMSIWDKLALEAGWLLLFCVLCLLLPCYSSFCRFVVSGRSDRGVSLITNSVVAYNQRRSLTAHPGPSSTLYGFVWGEGPAGACVSAGIIVLSIANFLVFIWKTEQSYNKDYKLLGLSWDAYWINQCLELFSFVIYLPVTLIRILTIRHHPDWKRFGWAAPLRYAVADLYIVAEEVALVFALMDLVRWCQDTRYEHLNLMFIFFARSFDMLERSGAGLGVRQLRHMVLDDGRLLLTSFVMGLVVWLIMSGLYFTANRENPSETANWAVATYEGVPWQKFESIPSTMWFVLVNLLKEHPLADAHETFLSRLWVCVVCIFAMPIFAVPVSILEGSLFKAELKEEEAEQERRATLSSAGLELPADEPEPPQPRPDPARTFWAGLATGLLVFGSILLYFYKTARDTDHAFLFGIPLRVSEDTWLTVDVSVALVFLVEWMVRMASEGPTYPLSFLGIIDLCAWLPGLSHVVWAQPSFWQSLNVLRVFKMERYFHSLRDVWDVTVENKAVLTATFLLSMLVWMFFTVVTYHTEVTNPDPEMRENFGSGMRSMWSEIINLHGEWPWADYTTRGKAWGSVIGVFSVMLFCVPIGIFSEALKQKVQDESDENNSAYDRRPWQQRCRPEEDGWRRKVHDLFYSHWQEGGSEMTPGFNILAMLNLALVAATTVATIVSTEPVPEEPGVWTKLFGNLFYVVDGVGTVFFALDYFGRVLATGWRHPVSFIGICDLLSLVAFATSLIPTWRDSVFHPSYKNKSLWAIKDDAMVLLRLLRLFSLESYIGAMHHMNNVFHIYCWPLSKAGMALTYTWFVHATLLYECEHQEKPEVPDGEGDPSMAYRYRSILTSLQFSIVHLFGDYPAVEYNFAAKVVHFVGIMGGIAVIATFCGVFSGCITSYLEHKREEEMRMAAVRRVMLFMRAVRLFQRGYRRMKDRVGGCRSCLQTLNPYKMEARSIAYEMTARGKRVMGFFHGVLLLAILNNMVSTLPETDATAWVEYTCNAITAFCTVVFIVEYVIRIAAYPKMAFTFWRVLDLVCLLPGPVHLTIALSAGRNGLPWTEAWCEALAMVRAARILEFSYFSREVTTIARAVHDALPKLAIPAYLALCIWIQTSALFMWLENYYRDEPTNVAESMRSVPEAMYWCCIFLTGEWANIDFTYAGSRLCILYVIFGIAMVSLPVGILVEAVQAAVVVAAGEEKEVRMLMRISKGGSEAPSPKGDAAAQFATLLHEVAVEGPKRHRNSSRRSSARSSVSRRASSFSAPASLAPRAEPGSVEMQEQPGSW